MDLILLYGDVLYSDTISRPDIQHDFLEPCDVKLNPFMNDGCLMKLKLHDPLSWRQGDNNVDGALCSRLEEVLEGEGFKAAYLVSFDYTMAIFKTAMGDGFWLFDSHAKDAYCKIKEDGKSFCGRYVTLQDLVCAYYQSYIIQPYSPFQLYPVSVIHTLLDPEEDPPMADNVPVLDPVGNGPPCGLQKNRKTRKRRTMGRCARNRKWKRIDEQLAASGIEIRANASPSEEALAEKCLEYFALAKEILRSREGLRQENLSLRRRDIRQFLSEKGVSDGTITQAECEARNHLRRPKGFRYTHQDMGRAIAIAKTGGSRALSVLHQVSMCPSKRRVDQVVQGVIIDAGISEHNVLASQIGRMLMSEEDLAMKFVTLAFDETKVMPHLAPKPREGMILGYTDFGNGERSPHVAEYILAFAFQGLVVDWTFPLGFLLTQTSTKGDKLSTLIPQAIRAGRNLGLKVMITSCDQASTNRNAITTLTNEHPVIEDGKICPGQFEVDGEPVIAIYDPAHIVKCARNTLLGGKNALGGSLEWPIEIDGTEIMFELHINMFKKLRTILERQGASASLGNLTDAHLDPKNKMKVQPAIQLFSSKNAALFEMVGDRELAGASKAAKVCRDLDEFIDLTIGHSSRETEPKGARMSMSASSPHKTRFPELIKKLKKATFYNYYKGQGRAKDTIVKRRSTTPVLKTWLQTAEGYMALQDRLQKEGVESVNVRKASSCFLESAFGEYKAFSGKSTTAEQFLAGVKTVLIKGIVIPKSNSRNCQDDGRNAQESLRAFLREDSRATRARKPPKNQVDPEESDSDIDDPEVNIPVDYPETSDTNSRLHSPLDVPELEAAQLALIVMKKHMKKTVCARCRGQLTVFSAKPVHSALVARRPRLEEDGLPSESLVGFVKTGQSVFRGRCHILCHISNVFEELTAEIAEHTDLSWFRCQTHHDRLRATLTQELIFKYCQHRNKCLAKRAPNQNQDKIGQVIRDVGIDVGEEEFSGADEQLEENDNQQNQTAASRRTGELVDQMILDLGIEQF